MSNIYSIKILYNTRIIYISCYYTLCSINTITIIPTVILMTVKIIPPKASDTLHFPCLYSCFNNIFYTVILIISSDSSVVLSNILC